MNLENKNINHPFKVSDNYFAELEKNIIAEQQLLSKVGNKNAFSTDEHYFENFEANILNRTVNKPKAKQISFMPYFRAAAAILVAGLAYFTYNAYQQPSYDLSSLNTDEIVAYLDAQPISLDYYEDSYPEALEINSLDMLDVTDTDLEDFIIPE